VFSKADPVSPARVLADFAKKVDKLKIRGGFFEGNFLSESGVKDLATMPSKEESQAQLLATMLAPATQLVRTLMEPAAQLVRLLEARRKQLEEKA
jgi:large subunit ribosomal protein L10